MEEVVENVSVDVVKTTLYIKKLGGNLKGRILQCAHRMCKGHTCVEVRERGERTVVVVVGEASVSGDG